MDTQYSTAWLNCLKYIQHNVSPQAFETWFAPIEFVECDGNLLTLRVPNDFVCEFLEAHYIELIRSAIVREFGKNMRLMYKFPVDNTNGITTVVSASEKSTLVEPNPTQKENKAPDLIQAQVGNTPQPLLSNLNPRYTFDNFIEGSNNRLLRTIGLSIANTPSQATFNPFFVFGGSGVGKTHLVNAIGIQLKEKHPARRVLYVSAHLFGVQYTDSIRNNKFNDFINFYQTIDTLIVDDIQEIAGRTKTQNAFFHIFNHLQQNNKQVILTSDRPPVMMEGFEDRLISRFKWGISCELERPKAELRQAILIHKIEKDGLTFSTEVIDYITENVTESIRDIEGVVNSLLAYSVVYNCEINLELAHQVVSRSVNLEKKPLTIESILEKVCKYCNVTNKDIFSASRKQNIVRARQIAMYLSQKHTKLPYAQIGLTIGKRDHSTVIHSCHLIEKKVASDKAFRLEMETFENHLQDKSNL